MYNHHLPTVHQALNHSGRRMVVARCSCQWTSPLTKKPETALRIHTEQHLAAVAKECPCPGKRQFKNEYDATVSLMKFWRTARGKTMPIRVYECRCGMWHTTHQPKRSGGDRCA